MQNSQLNKVIRLIARTGDKAIIMDKETDEAIVMMPLDNYEQLLDEAEFVPDELEIENDDELVPNFNGNFDFPWENETSKQEPEKEVKYEDVSNFFTEEKKEEEKDEIKQENKLEDDWFKAKETRFGQEESLADLPSDDEEEEKFYLEPVE